MSEAAIVSGVSGTIKTLADGTFRVQIDIEPRFAQNAFRLFGTPGTPAVLVRITNEAAVEHDRAQQDPAKGGALAKLAGMWCQEPEFWAFLSAPGGQTILNAEEAANAVRAICGVESRADLDHNAHASMRFQELIRLPYMRWMAGDRG